MVSVVSSRTVRPPPRPRRRIPLTTWDVPMLSANYIQKGLLFHNPTGTLLWRCITRTRKLSPEKETTCRAAINNRGRLRPQLPAEYFGNAISTISTEAVRAPEFLERRHGWAAAAVGRAVAAHTDAAIRERVAALTAKPPEKDPPAYMMSWHDPCGTLMGSSPRFDMFGCDFGWGKPVVARSGKANKVDGGTSLYPCRDGAGGMDAELTLTPEHMAALEEDEEFWAAVSPDAPGNV